LIVLFLPEYDAKENAASETKGRNRGQNLGRENEWSSRYGRMVREIMFG
jgi:hypothetical protein